jgi:hypothetical protein
MDQIWDAGGEAGGALAHVVEGFGAPVLGRPDMLEGLLKDDVPQLPREVAMLTEAARFGVADQLADRVQQGVAAQAAIAMVATEMTSRTAVDASGALWAAGVFARVIGYQVAGPPIAPVPDPQSQQTLLPTPVPAPPAQPALQVQPTTVEPTPMPPDPVPSTRVLHDAAEVTRRLDADPGFDGATIGVEGLMIPPRGDYPQTGPPIVPITPSGLRLGVPAALATGLTLVMLLFWVLSASSHADTVRAWTGMLPLVAGGVAIAIWAGRGLPGGVGFAAVVGLTVPAISFAIYDAAIAAELLNLSAAKRHVLEGTSIVAILAAIAAACIAVAALNRWRQIGPPQPDGLSVLLSIAGVCFVLANIIGQVHRPGQELIGNVLGPRVAGWWILWGLIFLVAFGLPPALAIFLRPGSPAHLAVWVGWLLIVFAWQISDSPTDGYRAAAGLYVTWICWLIAAACTAVFAFRKPVRP